MRAKVTVFAELYRKTQQLERLNRELEQRVAERTEELRESESQFRSLANSIPQLAWMTHADGSLNSEDEETPRARAAGYRFRQPKGN